MIRCEPMKGGDEVKVTFALAEDRMNSEPVAVVGDFNDWDPTASPLHPEGDMRVATVTLPAGHRYAFRYLAEGGQWFNDEEAHEYEPNDFGGEDSVLDLRTSADSGKGGGVG